MKIRSLVHAGERKIVDQTASKCSFVSLFPGTEPANNDNSSDNLSVEAWAHNSSHSGQEFTTLPGFVVRCC